MDVHHRILQMGAGQRVELSSDRTFLRCREAVLKFLYERHRFVEAAE